MRVHARGLTKTAQLSGGALRHFCEPSNPRSIPQSSTRTSVLKADATKSTRSSAPTCCATLCSCAMGCRMPLGVSQCTAVMRRGRRRGGGGDAGQISGRTRVKIQQPERQKSGKSHSTHEHREVVHVNKRINYVRTMPERGCHTSAFPPMALTISAKPSPKIPPPTQRTVSPGCTTLFNAPLQ